MEYLNDPEEALVALVQGQVWSEAIRLIYKFNRLDLYETNLKPGLLECYEETKLNLDKKLNTFQEYVSRFVEVVKMKEKLAEGNFEETDINIEDADMYSDITSQVGSHISKTKSKPGSIKTRVSKKSSRSRRKEELKKYSTKEGSKYEDLGLMAAIHDFVSASYKSSFTEVSQLLRALVKFQFIQHAKDIQENLERLENEFKARESVIWNPKWLESDEQLKFGPEATTEDIIHRANAGYKPEFSILEAKFRLAPVKPASCNDWKLQMLQ